MSKNTTAWAEVLGMVLQSTMNASIDMVDFETAGELSITQVYPINKRKYILHVTEHKKIQD